MDWTESYTPCNSKRDYVVVSGGAIGVSDYAIQEAQKYACHFQILVPYDHYIARARDHVLRNPS